VNHEIENDIDIERPGSEHAEPVDFKKHRLSDKRRRSPNRWIEAFQVSDLSDAVQAFGQAKQFVSFRQRRGQWFFHQHFDPGFHQGPRGLQMPDGWNRYRGGLHLAVSGHQLLDRSECAAAEFGGNRVSTRHVGIDNTYQTDGFTLLRQLVIDAGMIAAKSARADNCDVYEAVSQLSSPDFLCALCGVLGDLCG